jgi:type IV secretion system protein VirB6
MSAPADFHFYQDTFANLNTALGTYVGDVAGNIIGAISGVAYSMLMIYVMLWGWSVMRGMISEPITDGVARILRLAVIVGVALNLGRYNTYLSNFLWTTPDALANLLASGYSDSDSNVQYLDGLLSKIFDLGNAYWTKAGAIGTIMPDIALSIAAILIWTAGVIATAYGAFLLALSKMALAILLGIGPIFVLLLIFDGTKRFFDSWIGQALNYVFLVVLTAAAIKLILTILSAYLLAAAPGTQADPTMDKAIPAIVLCVIAALVMMQLPSIASALGGGVAIGTLGAVGWAFGKATGTAAAMRPTNLKRSINRLRSDARIARGAIGKTVGMPAAVYRKVTGANKTQKQA